MAFSASAGAGFRDKNVVSGDEILWLPTDPGVTYNKGDRVGMGGPTSESSESAGKEGVLILDADIDKNSVGTIDSKTIGAAATVAFAKGHMPGKTFDPVYDNQGTYKSLAPVRTRFPAGTPIQHVLMESYIDEVVISYTASTRAVAGTTGAAADDYPNGAIAVVYEGPGKGEVNIVEDYDHTGGAAELLYIFHRPFIATLTSASKMLILAGEAAASRGVCLMGRCTEGTTSDRVTVDDGANDGEYIIFCDFLRIADYVLRGELPVVDRFGLYT